jgi:hypothetical protein
MPLATKTPAEIKEYCINMAPEMKKISDVITASSWTVPAGITEVSRAFTDTTTIIWLTGGTVGNYKLINVFSTAGGRTFERALTVKVREVKAA